MNKWLCYGCKYDNMANMVGKSIHHAWYKDKYALYKIWTIYTIAANEPNRNFTWYVIFKSLLIWGAQVSK